MKSSRIQWLRPSSAHTWRRCAGYAALMTGIRVLLADVDNEVREDGTATHWLAQQRWDAERVKGYTLSVVNVGDISPNGRVITDELIRGAEEYLDVLRSLGEGIAVESQLPTGSIFPGTQDGTPDAYQVTPMSTTGRLLDLKMGFRIVEVWRNDQLIVYGWTLFCLYPHLTEMELTIVQPRAAHRDGTVRTWRVTREEMRPLAEALQGAALNAHADSPLLTVNESCRNCAAAHECEALRRAGGEGIEISWDSTPMELTAVEMAYELTKLQQAAKHIEHRITGLSAQAESIIRSGQRVPGFELSRAATRYRWPDAARVQIEQMGRLMGVEVHEPPKLLSPAKLRNVIPGLNVQTMYAELPTGELVLKATDPQQALKAFTSRK